MWHGFDKYHKFLGKLGTNNLARGPGVDIGVTNQVGVSIFNNKSNINAHPH